MPYVPLVFDASKAYYKVLQADEGLRGTRDGLKGSWETLEATGRVLEKAGRGSE